MTEIKLTNVSFIVKGDTAKRIFRVFCSNKTLAEEIVAIHFSADVKRRDFCYTGVYFNEGRGIRNNSGKLYRGEFCSMYNTRENFDYFVCEVTSNVKLFMRSHDILSNRENTVDDLGNVYSVVPYEIETFYGVVLVDDIRGILTSR